MGGPRAQGRLALSARHLAHTNRRCGLLQPRVARSQCVMRRCGVALCACAVCLRGVRARCACAVCLRGVLALCACAVCLRGVLARWACDSQSAPRPRMAESLTASAPSSCSELRLAAYLVLVLCVLSISLKGCPHLTRIGSRFWSNIHIKSQTGSTKRSPTIRHHHGGADTAAHGAHRDADLGASGWRALGE